jgi:aminomethyltransferase
MTDHATETAVQSSREPSASRDAIARSPVHQQHAKLGATFRREGPFELPAMYGDLVGERKAIREGLAVADVTARAKVDLRGPVDEVLGRLPSAPDLLRVRLSAQWALLLSGPATGEAYLRAAEAAVGSQGMATDATSIYAGFILAGLRVDDLLGRLTAFNVASLKPGAAIGTQVAKIAGILVSSASPVSGGQGRGCEILVPSEYGRYLWESLMQTGHPFDIRPVGWDALRAEGWS